MNRARSSLLGVVMLTLMISLSAASPTPAQPSSVIGNTGFSDVSQTDNNALFIKYIVQRGLMHGFPDGTFRPNQALTRAQAAVILAYTAGLQVDTSGASQFNDIEVTYWAAPYIKAATRAGYLSGYPDGTYRPEQTLTRAQGISLLLRLSKQESTATLPALEDMNAGHWAAKAAATGLASGMIGLTADNKNFLPDEAMSRSDLARALGVLITGEQSLYTTALSGQLKDSSVNATLSRMGQPVPVTAATTINAGDMIQTGPNGTAELVFPDGSGILIKEKTTLTVKESRGRAYIKPDGTPGTAVEWLVLDLKQGEMFGALATSAEAAEQGKEEVSLLNNAQPYALVASLDDGWLAAAKSANKDLPWYQAKNTKRVKVKVDMPWGVAAIRGTFWQNQVDENGQSSTSLLTGEGEVTSGGQTVTLGAGQQTAINSAQAPPAAPQTMAQAQMTSWAQVGDWARERAQEIENRQEAPLAPPPPAVPAGQQNPATIPTPVIQRPPAQTVNPGQNEQRPSQDIVNIINNAINNVAQASTGNTTPSGGGGGPSAPAPAALVSSVDALNSKVTLTFSKTISESHIDESGALGAIVSFTDGSSYKISILDSQGQYSMCLHSVNYTDGTNNLQIITPGAKPGEQYNITVYKGTGYTQVETTRSFTFLDTLPPEFITGYPRMENISNVTADLIVQIHETGTAYYVALLTDKLIQHPEYAPATSASVKNWNTNNQISYWSGCMSLDGNPEVSNLGHLRSNSSYTLYIVAEDGFGNLMPAISIIKFQTALAGHTISGGIYQTGGINPIGDVEVHAYDSVSGELAGWGVTDDKGQYSIDVPAGEYYIFASPGEHQLSFANTWYDSQYDNAYVRDLDSVVKADTSGININLAPGGSISGIVEQNATTPLGKVSVTCRKDLGNGDWIAWDTVSDYPDGNFAMYGLPYGNYYVYAPSFNNVGLDDNNWGTVWYRDNSLTQPKSAPITLDPTTPDISNIVLNPVPGGVISGQVTDLPGDPIEALPILARDSVTDNLISWTETDENGNYSLRVPLGGQYNVLANPGQKGWSYANTWYDNTVTAGTANVNFSLAPGGSISGVVKDINSNPIAGVSVGAKLYLGEGNYLGMTTTTDSDGSYTLEGLPFGNWKISAPSYRKDGPSDADWSTTWYPGKSTEADAGTITIESAVTVIDIDFKLVPNWADQIITINNTGADDKVVVFGLTEGDVVKLYDAETGGSLLDTSDPMDTGCDYVMFWGQDLGADAGNIWVTVTSTGKSESVRVPQAFNAEGGLSTAPSAENITITNSTGAEDLVEVTGLAEGDVVLMYDVDDMLIEVSIPVAATHDTMTFSGLNLWAGSLSVTVATPGLGESTPVQKLIPDEPK